MRDKIRFDYAEAQIEVMCVVCSTKFAAFPDSENNIFSCLKCNRTFKFTFEVVALNNQEIIKERLKLEKNPSNITSRS